MHDLEFLFNIIFFRKIILEHLDNNFYLYLKIKEYSRLVYKSFGINPFFIKKFIKCSKKNTLPTLQMFMKYVFSKCIHRNEICQIYDELKHRYVLSLL